MFVKKFEAPSLEQALALVKHELGPNALILSTETKPKSLFKKPIVEVTAATEVAAEAAPEPKETTFDEAALREIFPHRKRRHQSVVDEAPTPVAATNRRAKVDKYRGVERRDLHDADETPAVATRTSHNPYEEIFLRAGFSSDSAKDFARQLIFDYSKQDLRSPSFLEKAKLRLISPSLKSYTADVFRAQNEWTFIGPPGSGKTSCVVKVALCLKSQGQKVAVCSHDRRKLLGRRELSTYARMIEVPYHEQTTTPKERVDVTLHDSPALAATGTDRSEDLEAACAGRSVCLVLDAGMRLSEMLRIYERAARLRPVAVAFTRFDGLVGAGVLHDFLKTTKLTVLGASLSDSFKTNFKFFEPTELGRFILKS